MAILSNFGDLLVKFTDQQKEWTWEWNYWWLVFIYLFILYSILFFFESWLEGQWPSRWKARVREFQVAQHMLLIDNWEVSTKVGTKMTNNDQMTPVLFFFLHVLSLPSSMSSVSPAYRLTYSATERKGKGKWPYHDRDVQDTELLLSCLASGVVRGSQARKVLTAVLVVNVEEQSAILQPLLSPSYQGNVLRVPRNLCTKKKIKKINQIQVSRLKWTSETRLHLKDLVLGSPDTCMDTIASTNILVLKSWWDV